MSLCPFLDQRTFMTACEQTVDVWNPKQSRMYLSLIDEEWDELHNACSRLAPFGGPFGKPSPATVQDYAAVVDGLIDLIYVCSGMLHSMGVDPNAAWNEVHRSNMSKVDAAAGRVLKRDDGKVLKPEGYFPPDLVSVVQQAWGMA